MFIGVPTVMTIFRTQAPPPKGSLKVEVIAHQWWWEFRYPEYGIATANEVHVQRGRPVHFEMTSADVIHSFWIPRLGGKRDVVPGRTNHLWMTPDRLGVMPGQCAEFCGISHANMRLHAVVTRRSTSRPGCARSRIRRWRCPRAIRWRSKAPLCS